MKIQKLMLCILSVMMLGIQSGCARHPELGNISVVTGLFLNKQQENYILLADCATFSGQNTEKTLQTKQILTASPSLDEAFASLEKKSETPLYFARTKVLLLGAGIFHTAEKKLLESLLDSQVIPADISVLRANISENEILSREDKSFGLPIDKKLEKEDSFQNCKLYQILKTAKEILNLPTVSLVENEFILNIGNQAIFQ